MIIVLVLAVVILAVALVSMLVLVCWGMRRERGRFLSNQPPTRTASAARTISGLHVRKPARSARSHDGAARASASRSTSFVI